MASIKTFDVYLHNGTSMFSFRVRQRGSVSPELMNSDRYKYIFSISGKSKNGVMETIINSFKWGGIKNVMMYNQSVKGW